MNPRPFAARLAACLLLPLLLSTTAPARAGGLLGSLYDTCLGALGEPVNYARLPTPAPGAEVYAFRQRGWVITVFFWKHHAHLIIYEKPAQAPILPTETDVILRAYGNAQPWTRGENGHRRRRDGRAQARVGPERVAIFSTEFNQANALHGRP